MAQERESRAQKANEPMRGVTVGLDGSGERSLDRKIVVANGFYRGHENAQFMHMEENKHDRERDFLFVRATAFIIK